MNRYRAITLIKSKRYFLNSVRYQTTFCFYDHADLPCRSKNSFSRFIITNRHHQFLVAPMDYAHCSSRCYFGTKLPRSMARLIDEDREIERREGGKKTTVDLRLVRKKNETK